MHSKAFMPPPILSKQFLLPGLCCLLLTVFSHFSLSAQEFFKVLDDADLFYNQQIASLPNGDILIGDSSLESLRSGGVDGRIYLSRMDPCGNILWSNSYLLASGYLELKDVCTNDQGDIFAYGSYYEGLEELIFLLKVDGRTGESGDYHLYDPGTVDHFSYSISWSPGRLMIYGLIFDFNTLKDGFAAVFNEDLGLLWSKKFTPFESNGAAIFCQDGGILGRSKEFLIKLNSDGDMEWSTEMRATPSIKPIGGPMEVSGGYLLEAHQEGYNFIYKIDGSGNMLWQSDLFPAKEVVSAMSVLADGTVLYTYAHPEGNFSRLAQLIIDAEGRIQEQRRLNLAETLDAGAIYQILDEENNLTVSGNFNPFTITPTSVKDFVLRFSLDTLPKQCMTWEVFNERLPNYVDPIITAYDSLSYDFNLRLRKKVKTEAVNFGISLTDICEETINPDELERDTFLNCEESWTIELPADDFEWVDGFRERERVIREAGVYQARKRSCDQPLIIDYQLRKPDCGCPVFIPNVFTPNDDGQNDRLEYFADCDLETVEFAVFNRWGSRLFYSTDPDQNWDGRFRNEKAPLGVYLATFTFTYLNNAGEEMRTTVYQDVTLVR